MADSMEIDASAAAAAGADHDGAEPQAEGTQPMDANGLEDADKGAEEVLPELQLDIFDVARSAQVQHGLRHGDYGRYRLYCSRRLHRLRKASKWTHGRGRYAKRPLEPKAVREPRHLEIVLFCAERAWSYAMQLKRENTQQEPRPRFHLLARLAKASHWASKLASLCAARGDKRTELEANAYAAFMSGNHHLEKEAWAAALGAFKRCATICTELCRVSLADQVHLYRQMVAEVEPSIRFCTYNLRQAGELTGDSAQEDEFEGLFGAEGASDILRSKLEHVLQETREKQAKDLNELEYLGERVPIKNDKTRVSILRSQQLLMDLNTMLHGEGDKAVGSEEMMGLFDKLFVAYNDALESVRNDLRQAAKEHSTRATVAESALAKLQAALTWRKLHYTVRRTLLLVEKHRKGSGGNRRRSSPEDLVRLYDGALNSLGEMAKLEGYKEEETLMGQVAARVACAKAYRCYYAAESYGAVDKWQEAQVLYERAAALLIEAQTLYEEYMGACISAGLDDAVGHGEDNAALAQLGGLIEGAKARAHAQAVLLALRGPPAVAAADAELKRLSIDGDKKVAVADVPLLHRLDQFHAADAEHIIDFPPRLEVVACKPILFDIARNQIQVPDLSARTTAKKSGGGWGGWFTRS